MVYPSGRTVTYGFDGAGQVNTVSGLMGSTAMNYTDPQSLIGYAPHGAAASLKLGDGLIETTTYNPRLQETGIQVAAVRDLRQSLSDAASRMDVGTISGSL